MTEKNRVLLVDDDEFDLELFCRAIESCKRPVAITIAKDGFEALELLAGLADEQLPKLIVVDYKMPRMDGTVLLEKFRSSRRLRNIPAVVLTSSKDRRDIQRAYAAGANAYVVKPVNFSEFSNQVSVLVEFWLALNQVEGPA